MVFAGNTELHLAALEGDYVLVSKLLAPDEANGGAARASAFSRNDLGRYADEVAADTEIRTLIRERRKAEVARLEAALAEQRARADAAAAESAALAKQNQRLEYRVRILCRALDESPGAAGTGSASGGVAGRVPMGHTGFSWAEPSQEDAKPGRKAAVAKAAPAKPPAPAKAAPKVRKPIAEQEAEAAAKKEGGGGGGDDDGGKPKMSKSAMKKAAKAAKKAAKKKEKGGGGGQKQPRRAKKSKQFIPEEGYLPAQLLDVRVGKIVKAWPHPSAEKLYCEEIDVGEDAPRTIASGLRAFYSEAEMQGRMCVVICNLKPRKMQGFKSCGMVFCASNADHTAVEFVAPPPGAKAGERVVLTPGHAHAEHPAAPPNFVAKKKVFEACLPDLATDAGKVATYKGMAFTTASGVCTVPSLASCGIK